MKQTNFKSKRSFLISFFLLGLTVSLRLIAQPAPICGMQGNPGSQSSSSQPTNCIQLLKDFVPSSFDSVLIVRVNFYVFSPTVGTGTWDNNTITNAQAALNVANYKFSNIAINSQSVSSPYTPVYISHTKIQFVLASFNMIQDHATYINVQVAPTIPTYDNPSAINVYYGAGFPNGGGGYFQNAYVDYPLPNNHIIMPFGIPGSTTTLNMNDATYSNALAHELGHTLGIDHPVYNSSVTCDGADYIDPTFGCCNHICANDYVLENPPVWAPCGTSGGSNNLMSLNNGCQEYLSPQQMAIMHYHLRTSMKGVLTTKSYNDATKVNQFIMYNVTSNETWQDGDRHFKGHITVKANKTLTVKCGVSMTKGAKIIVEAGAMLVVDGGTITNISGRVWDGIFLVGNPNQPQKVNNPNNPGSTLYQAILKIINGGTISHATAGVRNHYSSFSNAGGYIFGMDANFIDNYIDVKYIGQQLSGTTQIPNASVFYRCNFKTVGTVGDGFGPYRHISISKTSGIQFYGCVFQYASTVGIPHGDGIYSENGNYTVNKNGSIPTLFQNLNKGIYVNNFNTLKTPNIMNCSFVGNLGYGAYFKNADMLSFQSNTVQAYQWGEGVYLNECTKYKIKNNVFTQTGTPSAPGLSIFRSKTGAHEVYRNTFSGLFMGINCMDDNGNPNPNSPNDGLIMNCNDFHQTANLYDIVLSYASGLALPRVRKNQGEVNSQLATAFNLVRNIYGATCNSNQNKWQIYSGSTVTINHGSNTNTLTAVTQPTANGCKSSYLNVVDQNINLNYTVDCAPYPPSSGGTSTTQSQRLASMNDYIGELKEDEIANSVSHHSEIQSTVISKLDLFLTDTLLYSPDSVISVLENNPGYMEDADIKTVFAYMNKGDYEEALEKVDAMSVNRSDWMALLTKLIELEQDTLLLTAGLSANDREFFLEYATTDNMDGQSIAQAYLKALCDSNYTEPHALPEGEGARAGLQTEQIFQSSHNINVPVIKIYPNPAQTSVNIYYRSLTDEPVKIEIRDLPGKLIYTNFIYGGISDQYIPLDGLNNGMYLITLTRDKQIVYTGKIVKQE